MEGKRELHVLCFGPGSAEVRDREAEKFSVPFPHGIDLAFTSMTWSSHASALCKHSSSSPFPSFLLFGSTSGTADTSSCCSSLVSPRPASGSVCASYGQHAAGWGEVPHLRCKAHTFLMVPALLALGQGIAPLLSSWDGGAGQV